MGDMKGEVLKFHGEAEFIVLRMSHKVDEYISIAVKEDSESAQ